MATRTLTVIPEPDKTKTTIFAIPPGKPNTETVILRSEGDIDMKCGSCGAYLAKSMNHGQMNGVVFLCNGCGSFNQVP